MGKDIGCLYKNNQSKLSTPTLKKPVLSSSASRTSSAGNSTRISISYILDNKMITNNYNNNKISNTDDIQSCVTPRKNNYSVQVTSTLTHLTPLDSTLPIPSVKLHTTTKLPPDGKEYFCVQINVKSSQATKCVKSRIMTKVIGSILSIDTFEQQCVVLKGVLQSSHLRYHMKTIGIDQSVSTGAYFEHKCLDDI